MVLFLTSLFLEYRPDEETGPVHLIDDYGFVDNLKGYWRENSSILIITSDPDADRINKIIEERFDIAFNLAGLTTSSIKTLDNTNMDNAFELVRNSDVIILSGGNGNIQNAFFKKIMLKNLLVGYPGIIIAMGCGSTNCAENAYLVPEYEGQVADLNYEKFTDGLGLTDISIIPHFSALKTLYIQGKNLIDDVVFPDSVGRCFYLLDDGSYFLIDGDVTKFYGVGKALENGTIRTVDTAVSENDWNAVMTQGFISVFEINLSTLEIIPKFSSGFLNKYDVSVTNSKTFGKFINDFTNKIVVENERESMFEHFTPEIIKGEIERLGNFCRTVHTERGGYRRALDVRIKHLVGDPTKDICIIQDITEIIDRDWMTDILSRTGFLRDAERMLKRLDLSVGYSLIYTNIRGFKTINDLFGEESGDSVIFMVRDKIVEVLEPIVIGRLESDHFVAIVKNDLIKNNRMRKITQMTFRTEYKMFDFTVTCGIYHIDDTGVSVGIMIDRAKLAEANLSETDSVLYTDYTDKMRKDYVNHMILVSDIGDALRHNELISYYQPIVDTYTHKIVSAESLIRWKHRDMGMVSPGLFIPALEESGKVSRVDLYMAENVFGLLLRNAREGLPIVPISINLSRVDFYDPSLLERIKEILEERDFPEGAAKIEITESAYANLERNALDFLRTMKEKKVRIMLDDYGSGMSSLSTLESYEFDTIKLDIGFIRKIDQSPKAETIIRSTINMAHAFGADVVAEGVETEKQLAFLSDAGCDMIQGYYFYRPMSEEDFIRIMDNPSKTDMRLTWRKD
ncbi:MAG: EAL domain-containing protein [Lachnospiraceae bacterium]|nr:EAL domain-containing protein [Lachnospiraceae bacterium]